MAIPRQMLPQVVSSAGVAGIAAPDLFGAEIPVAGRRRSTGRLFGQTCFAPGGEEHLWDRFISA